MHVILPTYDSSPPRTEGMEGILKESHNDNYEFSFRAIYVFRIDEVPGGKLGFSRASQEDLRVFLSGMGTKILYEEN